MNHYCSSFFPSLPLHPRAFDVELLYIAQQLEMPVKEVAVNWQEIEGKTDTLCMNATSCSLSLSSTGTKMVPFFSWAQMGRDLLFIRARYTFSIWTINSQLKKEQ